jgi:hypothetical protein
MTSYCGRTVFIPVCFTSAGDEFINEIVTSGAFEGLLYFVHDAHTLRPVRYGDMCYSCAIICFALDCRLSACK